MRVRQPPFRVGQLGQGTLWMLVATIARVATQGAAFLIVARTLGAPGFGAFASCLALASAFAPFAGLGAGNLLVRDGSRDPAGFRLYWGRTNALIGLSAGSTLLMFVATGWLVLPPALFGWTLLNIGVAELVFARVIEICGQAFQSRDDLRSVATIQALAGIVRLIAAVAFFKTPGSATRWSMYYLAAAAAAAVIAHTVVSVRLGRPKLGAAPSWRDAREGVLFSVSLSAQSVYNDSDKIVLARAGTLGDVASYAIAYRVVDYSFLPVASLLSASYARFFRSGATGISATLAFAGKLLPIAAGFGVLAGVAVAAVAPAVPRIVGATYIDVSRMMLWLAPLGVLRALHYLAADSLTGAGFQRVRAGAQVFVAAANVAVCLVVIPVFGWRGAALTSVTSDAVLACLLWTFARALRRRELGSTGVRPRGA